MGKIFSRSKVDAGLDYVRFVIDRYPGLGYQPLPWVGIPRSRRSTGTSSRWDAMLPLIEATGARSLVDIGCDVGWFVFSAGTRGLTAIGMEPDARSCRLFLYVKRKLGLDRVGLLTAELNQETARVLPTADSFLFLSIWHHLVRHHGLAGATDLLKAVWKRTSKVLFFETGEREMPERFHLPEFTPDARQWIEEYLTENLGDSQLLHLGQHDAFSPDGAPCLRNLFAVIREKYDE